MKSRPLEKNKSLNATARLGAPTEDERLLETMIAAASRAEETPFATARA